MLLRSEACEFTEKQRGRSQAAPRLAQLAPHLAER
jgi:hypothetical protein